MLLLCNKKNYLFFSVNFNVIQLRNSDEAAVTFLKWQRVAGYPLPARGAANLRTNGNIEISSPKNSKIATNNHKSVISFEFWCDGG